MTKRFFLLIAIILLSYNINFGIYAKDINIKISSFNVEWFGCTSIHNGPEDKKLQMDNVVSVIQMMGSDIVALQEVGHSNNYSPIDTLAKKLGTNWKAEILPVANTLCGQNQGIVYNTDYVEFQNSLLLNSEINGQDYDFRYNWSNGRYPVVYNVNVIDNDESIPLTLVNIHAKAHADETSYTRRKGGSQGLKHILDGEEYNTKNVVIIGDFNDFLEGTICKSCYDSPYKNFMDDYQNYMGLTTYLLNAYNSSIQVVDNIVISNELFDNYITDSSILEHEVANNIYDYRNTTSDHTPVSALFKFEIEDPYEENDCNDFEYYEDFLAGLGDFSTYSVYGEQDWRTDPVYGAVISGHASGIDNENENWLISPPFNLSNMNSVNLSFDHALNYCSDSYFKTNNHTIWLSENYNDEMNPHLANWTQITIPIMPSGNNWVYTSSGNIKIPKNFFKNNVRFAFKYLSNTDVAGYWEVRNLTLNGICTKSAIKTEIETEAKIKWHIVDGTLHLDLESISNVQLYSILGNKIYENLLQDKAIIPIQKSGIYIMRINDKSYKISVDKK